MNVERILGQLRRVRRSGAGWSAACPAHDDRRNSFSLHVRHGRVLLYCHAGCEYSDILETLNLSAADLRVAGEEPQMPSREDRIKAARRLWGQSQPASHTVVQHYLRKRGITVPIPRAIRFIPLLMHREYGWPFPVMIGGAQNPAGEFAGVIVTWLSADGNDKAPVETPRKIFGPIRGGAVRLAPAGETLALAEGIETALSILQATGLATWAALGTANLIRVELPVYVREVTICADADPAGERAACEAAARFIREGRQVRIARPELGRDFNDYLRAAQ